MISDTFHLKDVDGVYKYSAETLRVCMEKMGYNQAVVKHQYIKSVFQPHWKYIAHVILKSISSRMENVNVLSTSVASMMVGLVYLQNFSYSRYIFDAMRYNTNKSKRPLLYPRFIQEILNVNVPKLRHHGEKLNLDTMDMNLYTKLESWKGTGVDVPLFPQMLDPNVEVVFPNVPVNDDDNIELQKEATDAKDHEKSAILEAEKNEVDMLKRELQQVREDREKQLLLVQELTMELRTCKEQLESSALEAICSSQGEQISILQGQLEKLKMDDKIRTECEEHTQMSLELQYRLSEAEAQLGAVNEKLKGADLFSLKVRTECEEHKRTVSELQYQLWETEAQLGAANKKLKMADMSLSEIRTECEEQKQIVLHLRAQLLEGENLRKKKLHNTILELKGNIRVFCRVRPMVPYDGPAAEATISFPTSLELVGRGIEIYQRGEKHPFTFDKVFDHKATQEEVFLEISQLMQSALDGYKVCIFAYGQTGSGKTYTMMGLAETPEQKGLIPRSLEQVFQTSQALAVHGWKFKLQASMLVIYKDLINDLLPPQQSTGTEGVGAGRYLLSPKPASKAKGGGARSNMLSPQPASKAKGGGATSYMFSPELASKAKGGGATSYMFSPPSVGAKKYSITHDTDGNTLVSGLNIHDVSSIREVFDLLEQGARSRSVAKTDMNEHSSRSHLVFTLRIYGENEGTGQQVQGKLNLIDLAGSEQLSKSGAAEDLDHLKETQAINKSLSALSNVINEMANKEKHVKFRDSTLTYLLQPCLGGDSKTLMFVNISPTHRQLMNRYVHCILQQR